MVDQGLLTLGTHRKIRSRFQILKPLKAGAETAALAAELHAEAQQLELGELQRLDSVLHLLCSPGISHGKAVTLQHSL